MLTSERRNLILNKIKKDSAVSVSDLLTMFDVSQETIRKDLLYLEQHYNVTRVHGGAVLKNQVKSFDKFENRINDFKSEKRELSKLAMNFIVENDVIGIDAGTTAIEFVEELMQNFNALTVVTYSLDVFEKLHDYKDFNVILLGGTYMRSERTFYGSLVRETLEKINLKKCFIFPWAISVNRGFFSYQPQILDIQKVLIKNSDSVFVLADSSKWEKTALYKMGDLSTEFTYLCDSKLPEKVKELYVENGYRVITEKGDI